MAEAAARMDRMYRWQTAIYDLTRKPYLLGRDRLIEALSPPPGGNVLEIGCGTGRNLIRAAQRWPAAYFFGFDVSQVMLDKAALEVKRAGNSGKIQLAQGDANDFSPGLFRVAQFDRIYFSYTLSMIPTWERSLEHALERLAPGGSIWIADFGDQRDLPAAFRTLLRAWLRLFDVHPRTEMESVLREMSLRHNVDFEFNRLYGGYSFMACLRRRAN